MIEKHAKALRRRINRGLNGDPARSKGSNTKSALRSERQALFSLQKGRKHCEYCLTCMLDCAVLRQVDNSHAASLRRSGGDDVAKARDVAVRKDIMEKDDIATYTFDTCPKIANMRGEWKE
jgi:hypothetical protein